MGIPKKRTVMYEPIMTSHFFKPKHQIDSPGGKKRGLSSTFYDPRRIKRRRLDPEAVENLKMPFSKQIRPFFSEK